MKRAQVRELADMAVRLSKIGMYEPLDIYPYAKEPYYKFLYLLMATGQFKTAVELGSFIGVGALHLALGHPRGGVVYTIDRDQSNWAVDCQAYAIPNIVRVTGDTCAAHAVIPDVIDLLFIDADHSYEAVKRDFRSWRVRIREGGIVLFDDRHWEGDTRYWDELAALWGDDAIVLDELHWSGFGAVLIDNVRQERA